MKTSTHTFPGATIEVTPTMQALGDQPYRCRVYPFRHRHHLGK